MRLGLLLLLLLLQPICAFFDLLGGVDAAGRGRALGRTSVEKCDRVLGDFDGAVWLFTDASAEKFVIALEHEFFKLELVLLDRAQQLLFAHPVQSVTGLF